MLREAQAHNILEGLPPVIAPDEYVRSLTLGATAALGGDGAVLTYGGVSLPELCVESSYPYSKETGPTALASDLSCESQKKSCC